MVRVVLAGLCVALFFASRGKADENRQENEIEIDASLDQVWKAFTTTEGLRSWVAPLADIEFKVGGKWRANYNSKGKLGDDATIENTILCYDPKRMMSIRPTKVPKGFPFAEPVKKTWTVFYFDAVNDSRTKVRVVVLGYDSSEPSRQLRAFFEQGNKQSLNQLAKSFTREPEKSPK